MIRRKIYSDTEAPKTRQGFRRFGQDEVNVSEAEQLLSFAREVRCVRRCYGVRPG